MGPRGSHLVGVFSHAQLPAVEWLPMLGTHRQEASCQNVFHVGDLFYSLQEAVWLILCT